MSTTEMGKALEKVIWEVHQIEKIMELGAASEDRLLDKIDHLVKVLPSLRAAAAATEAEDETNAEYPVDVLRHVDEGRNPVRFMTDSLLAVGELNKTTAGKANAFRRFHEALVEEHQKHPEGEGEGDGAPPTEAKEKGAADE